MTSSTATRRARARATAKGCRPCSSRSTTATRISSAESSTANPALDVFDAAAVGRTHGLEALLDGEPGLATAWSADGFTALHLAAFFGQEDAAKILLERGAEPNVVARNATIVVTPLHSAAAGAHSAIVKLLLAAGADPNARQPGGFTALDAAQQNGDDESAEALLAAGATPRPA